jgi:hypothetical protein
VIREKEFSSDLGRRPAPIKVGGIFVHRFDRSCWRSDFWQNSLCLEINVCGGTFPDIFELKTNGNSRTFIISNDTAVMINIDGNPWPLLGVEQFTGQFVGICGCVGGFFGGAESKPQKNSLYADSYKLEKGNYDQKPAEKQRIPLYAALSRRSLAS